MTEVSNPFDEFVSTYGMDAPVRLGELTMTVGQALLFEAEHCTADPEKLADQDRRIRWMAEKLAAAGVELQPEHRVYLEPEAD